MTRASSLESVSRSFGVMFACAMASTSAPQAAFVLRHELEDLGLARHEAERADARGHGVVGSAKRQQQLVMDRVELHDGPPKAIC